MSQVFGAQRVANARVTWKGSRTSPKGQAPKCEPSRKAVRACCFGGCVTTYYEEHKEERKAYYSAHKEERLAYNRAYYATHKEEERVRNRAWRAAHKEIGRAHV